MRVLDLFSGIGGFSLGLEAAGFETIAFCEIDPFCRSVLKRHWPDVWCFEDVCTLPAGIEADVICGGFPCQDISVAGRNAGLVGARSGLWSEYRRHIEEIKPKWAIIENVSILRGRGLDQVLGELAEIGYDAEWHCIPASALGAHHERAESGLLPTPAASTYGSNQGGAAGRVGKVRHSLQSMAKKGLWPTPTASRRSGLQSHGINFVLGTLNPMWVAWFMGFPTQWLLTNSRLSEMQLSRKSPTSSAAQ
jgi:DNA (cytosine-5)-methyltransferase 1